MTKNNAVLRFAGAMLVVGSLFGTAALAQGTAVITGTVSDAATKQPVGDVVVTATSPNLQGEQIVVTDAAGLYRIPQLPSGVYTLRFEKEAYKPFSRGEITIRSDTTVRVNIDMLPEALQGQEIVVVGRAPTIDVGSTTTGVNVSTEFIRNIAVVRPGGKGGASRSFESLATIAPGANSDLYGVSINGTTSPENQFIIDGLSVNDPAFGINATPLTVDFISEVNVITGGYMPEFGRATGGIMNVVTKSGSNEFHGSVFGNWTPGVLEGAQETVRRTGQVINTESSLHNIGDFGAEVGGPIMKDKLWFFVGVAPSFTRMSLERQFNVVRTVVETGAGECGFRADQTTPLLAVGRECADREGPLNNGFTVVDRTASTRYFADARSLQFLGKLTYLVNSDHNVSLSISGTPTASGGNGNYDIDASSGGVIANILGPYEAMALKQQSSSLDFALKTASSFLDKRFLIDTTIGWHHQDDYDLPVDGSLPGSGAGLAAQSRMVFRKTTGGRRSLLTYAQFDPSIPEPALQACATAAADGQSNGVGDFGNGGAGRPTLANALYCPVSSFSAGGTGFIRQSFLDRYQGKAVGTYLLTALGHHVVKAGVDGEYMSFRGIRAYTGGKLLREATNGGSVTDLRQYGYLQGPDDAVILQKLDSTSISYTVGGFVQDSWNVLDLVTVNAGVRYDTQTMVDADGKVAIVLPNQVSPRVGLIYDFTQQGRSKLFANFARFYQNAVLDMIDRAFGAERQIAGIRTAANCSPLVQADWDSATRCQNNSLSSLALIDPADPNTRWILTSSDKAAVDPNLKPQSTDEVVVGGEYEVFADARVGASYTKRYMNEVIEDMSRDEANSYFIGNPGFGIAKDFPKAKRDYDAATVYLNKNFSDMWLAQVSYTWSSLVGNYAGLFRPETGQLDPNINSDFDLRSLIVNRDGPLPGDITHSFKVFGAKEFVFAGTMGVNLGLTYTGRTGTPLNYFASHALYGANEVFILNRGAGGRLEWRNNIDGHLGFNYRLSKDTKVELSVDVFNIFNFQGVAGRDQTYTAADVNPLQPADCGGRACTPADLTYELNSDGESVSTVLTRTDGSEFFETDRNPNFGNPTAYQAPRSIRFGARVTF